MSLKNPKKKQSCMIPEGSPEDTVVRVYARSIFFASYEYPCTYSSAANATAFGHYGVI